MTATPWLSQDEVDDLCKPLKQHAAQVRFIHSLGVTVRTKPNGVPLVMRTHLEEAMNPPRKPRTPAKSKPNREGLILYFEQGKKAAT